MHYIMSIYTHNITPLHKMDTLLVYIHCDICHGVRLKAVSTQDPGMFMSNAINLGEKM